jgi:hypothetical protein
MASSDNTAAAARAHSSSAVVSFTIEASFRPARDPSAQSDLAQESLKDPRFAQGDAEANSVICLSNK